MSTGLISTRLWKLLFINYFEAWTLVTYYMHNQEIMHELCNINNEIRYCITAHWMLTDIKMYKVQYSKWHWKAPSVSDMVWAKWCVGMKLLFARRLILFLLAAPCARLADLLVLTSCQWSSNNAKSPIPAKCQCLLPQILQICVFHCPVTIKKTLLRILYQWFSHTEVVFLFFEGQVWDVTLKSLLISHFVWCCSKQSPTGL